METALQRGSPHGTQPVQLAQRYFVVPEQGRPGQALQPPPHGPGGCGAQRARPGDVRGVLLPASAGGTAAPGPCFRRLSGLLSQRISAGEPAERCDASCHALHGHV